MGRAVLVGWVLAACAIAWPCGTAQAQDSDAKLDLRWTAPVGCPSRDGVLASVRRILAESKGIAGEVIADAVVVREGTRWHARVETENARGSGAREFEADSCAAIGGAVALIVALAVDEDSNPPAAPAPVPAKDEPVTEGPEPAPSPVPAPRLESPDAARSEAPLAWLTRLPARLAMSVSLGADSATLPSLSPGVQVALGLIFAGSKYTSRLEWLASYWGTQTANLPSRPGEGGSFTLGSVGSRICVARRLGPLEVGPSLGVEIDVVGATAFGGSVDRGGSAAWGALVGGGVASFALSSRLALRAQGEAVVAPERPTFVVDQPPPEAPIPVHRSAGVSARVLAGAELRFF